jgi:signal transduction histidine kinase
VALLNVALDAALLEAVQRYQEASQRLMKALDRVSTETVGSSTVDELLARLMRVLMETSPSIDSVTILLREGDRLRVRAAVGLVQERDAGFTLAIGEGFAGTVAARREPVSLRDASHDPLLVSDFIRSRGVRALYGVPLVETEVIGVAHIGSLTANEFSDEERLLFRALANRATGLIVEGQLRDAERSARQEAEKAAELLRLDIEERRRVEARLLDEAEDRERVMGILGHDLRTPLQAIMLSAHVLMRREALRAGVHRGIQRIATSADRLERMIRELLDFTRSRHGGIPVTPGPVDLGEIAEEVVAELEVTFPGRLLELQLEGDLSGEADRDRLAQVIGNLTVNALVHGDPAAPVTLRLGADEECLMVEVVNHGRPIPPDQQARLFEPFHRLSSSSRRAAQEGLGLGLYIVQQIVAAHGGQVEVRSAEVETCFTVTLPRRSNRGHSRPSP